VDAAATPQRPWPRPGVVAPALASWCSHWRPDAGAATRNAGAAPTTAVRARQRRPTPTRPHEQPCGHNNAGAAATRALRGEPPQRPRTGISVPAPPSGHRRRHTNAGAATPMPVPTHLLPCGYTDAGAAVNAALGGEPPPGTAATSHRRSTRRDTAPAFRCSHHRPDTRAPTSTPVRPHQHPCGHINTRAATSTPAPPQRRHLVASCGTQPLHLPACRHTKTRADTPTAPARRQPRRRGHTNAGAAAPRREGHRAATPPSMWSRIVSASRTLA
jgi:hypothetical protein